MHIDTVLQIVYKMLSKTYCYALNAVDSKCFLNDKE